MSKSVFFQGDDISVVFSTKKELGTDLSIGDFSRIKIFAYTSPCFVSRFSHPAVVGFHPITVINEDNAMIIIPSNDTKKMLGNIIVEMMFERESEVGDLKDNASRKINTGCFVKKTLIKHEI